MPTLSAIGTPFYRYAFCTAHVVALFISQWAMLQGGMLSEYTC